MPNTDLKSMRYSRQVSPKKSTPRNLTFDLVRIFACLWVWLYHWTGNAITWAEYSKPVTMSFSFIPTEIQHIFNLGFLGVDLFFVLSGCVIANSALRNSQISFAKNRFTRLFPAYLIASLATIVLYSIAGGRRGTLLGFFWLTGFPLLSTARPYIGPAWTLHHEIWFYCLVFLCLYFTGQKKRNLIRFANISAFTVFGVLIICHFTHRSLAPNSFILLLPYFLFGMFTQLLNSVKSWTYSLLGFCTTSLLVIYELNYRIGFKSYSNAAAIFLLILVFLVISRVESIREWTPPKSIQSTIRKVALMTYPIYLLHLTAGGALISVLFGAGLPGAFSVLVSATFVFFLSWWIVQIFEPKFKVMVKSF